VAGRPQRRRPDSHRSFHTRLSSLSSLPAHNQNPSDSHRSERGDSIAAIASRAVSTPDPAAVPPPFFRNTAGRPFLSGFKQSSIRPIFSWEERPEYLPYESQYSQTGSPEGYLGRNRGRHRNY
jgi:hypothetical protein